MISLSWISKLKIFDHEGGGFLHLIRRLSNIKLFYSIEKNNQKLNRFTSKQKVLSSFKMVKSARGYWVLIMEEITCK